MPRLSRFAPVLALVLAFAALAGAWRVAVVPGLRSPPSAAADFLPLWLGAALVEAGEDPTDAAAAEAQFRREALPLRPGGFYSYYPPTASLLALPLRPLGFRSAVSVWRVAGALAVVVGAVAGALAGVRGRPSRVQLAAALCAAAVVLLMRPARIVLPTGQPGPFVVVFTGVALWFFAQERTRAAAVAAALGVATKLVPVVLVPVWLVRRERRAILPFVATLGLLAAVLLGYGVPLHPIDWSRQLLAFLGRDPLPGWREQGWFFTLWGVRTPLVAVGSIGLLGRLWCHREAAVDVAVALVAAVGVVLAGSPHSHEALILAPAFAYALTWPAHAPRSALAWAAAGTLAVGCLTQPAAFARSGRPDSLVWVALGLLVWGVVSVRALGLAIPSRSGPAAGAGPG